MSMLILGFRIFSPLLIALDVFECLKFVTFKGMWSSEGVFLATGLIFLVWWSF